MGGARARRSVVQPARQPKKRRASTQARTRGGALVARWASALLQGGRARGGRGRRVRARLGAPTDDAGHERGGTASVTAVSPAAGLRARGGRGGRQEWQRGEVGRREREIRRVERAPRPTRTRANRQLALRGLGCGCARAESDVAAQGKARGTERNAKARLPRGPHVRECAGGMPAEGTAQARAAQAAAAGRRAQLSVRAPGGGGGGTTSRDIHTTPHAAQ